MMCCVKSPLGTLLAASVGVAAVIAAVPMTAGAQDTRDSTTLAALAVRIEEAPSIDGRLDESVWQQIAPITDFRQREPDEGKPATERTEVRIAYTESTLYFGITLHDSEPH